MRARGGGTDLSLALGTIDAFLIAIQNVLAEDFVVTSVSYALRDSNIFLPASYTFGAVGTISVDLALRSTGALETSFVGRTVTGGRVCQFVYGVYWTPGATSDISTDFRVLSSESTDIAAGVAALNTGLGLVGNDGGSITWYDYANVGYSAYWKKRLRQGA